VKRREILWESGQEAMQMGMLLSGRLKAVLRSDGDSNTLSSRTLQVILPGTIFGELGLLSRGRHSRTIIASADSRIAMLSRDTLDDIEETDKVGKDIIIICY
jgi:CRP-like cAMP-binding protein